MSVKDQLYTNYEEIRILEEKKSKFSPDSEEYKKIQNKIDTLNSENTTLKGSIGIIDFTPPTQDGHLYPVTLVANWTNKLKNYNAQLDSFIKLIDQYDNTANKRWVAEKVRKFCNKINYALAWLRYYIIKGLNGIFKKANDFLGLITPVIKLAGGDIGAVITWVNNVIKIFLKPYQTIVQFIKDFSTYTPPLVDEATSLVGKIPTIPLKIQQKILQKFGETVAILVSGISIKFEPISLGDITSGTVEKPKKEDYL